MATPHNAAEEKDIAPIVLMAGDPLRVKMIAKKYLKKAKLVSKVRNIYTYTGYYNHKRVTVMAHGMGNPSMGIYSYELFHTYHVETIIRVGTIGSLRENVHVRDVIVAKDCYTTTNYSHIYEQYGPTFFRAGDKVLQLAEKVQNTIKSPIHWGSIYSSDTFYSNQDDTKLAKEKNLLGVEMECAALYYNAQQCDKQALTICTVSDSLVTNENLSAIDRQNSFLDMIEFALKIIEQL